MEFHGEKMVHNLTRRKFMKTASVATLSLLPGCSVKNRFDLIIKNGTIMDGTGAPGKKADVGIVGNKIEALTDLTSASANQVIDAQGFVVAPGFVDIHTHTDTELLANPLAESKIRQGVTTEVGGNCGSAPFPLNEADFRELDQDLSEKYGVHVTWRTLPEFLETLEQQKISINYATLTGHGDLRAWVMGKNDVPPTPAQLKQMADLLTESMERGSFGLSTGLEYAPGSYARTDEIIALCQVVAEKQRLYATHIRNEDDRVEEALQEAIEICQATGVSTQVSHLKACNQANWHKVDHLLEMIHQAIAAGMAVAADRYPYIAYGTGLGTFLPLWARQGTTEEILARLEDETLIPKIKAYAESRGQRIGGWERVIVSGCFLPENKQWEGQSIQAAANKRALSPFEFIRQLIRSEKNEASIVGFAMNEANLKKVLSAPFVMVGSDGSAVAPYGKLAVGKPHPRYYGTFPRVLGRYCRDENYFDLATALKKMTLLPAQKLGLKQRGQLQPGYFADITIFNPAIVLDQATFENPHQYPIGIEYVIVNGKITIKQGTHTGEKAGSILRA